MTTGQRRIRNEAPLAATSGLRVESLTGLRWWAAFGIFLSHINVFLPIPYTRGVFGLGVAGVTFFFILSGFVLTWTFSHGDTAAWFYGRRFARVWPLLAIAIALPLTFALTSNMGVDPARLIVISVASVLLVQSWVPGWILEGPNPVTWSLSCEALFYVLFPLIVRPVLRRTFRQLLIIAAVLVVIGWAIRIWMWWLYPPMRSASPSNTGFLLLGTYSPVARLNEFLLGVVLAAAVRKGWRCPVSVRSAAALLAAGFAVLWLFRGATWRSAVPYDAVDQVTAPLFTLIIAAVVTRDLNGGRSWLRSRPLLVLGKWSYAFYLFHFLVVYPVASAVFHGKSVVDFFFNPVGPGYGHILWALLALVIALVLAGTLYRFCEHPIERRLRDRFKARFAPARTTGAMANR